MDSDELKIDQTITNSFGLEDYPDSEENPQQNESQDEGDDDKNK